MPPNHESLHLVGVCDNPISTLRIKISPRIREAYFNGKAYYRMNDAPLAQIPDRPELRPDPDRLDWHYKNCFQA
ncbi:hypothetical protein JKG47_19220 [Acidithiobacillus sp. MC6.1]|nr:hypothetical protein [Acidithiobacillus sp. MC6.1]